MGVGISNFVRNTALHLATPVKGINRHIEKELRRFHDLIGIDISDPDFFFPFLVPALAFNEDKSGNPLHLLLIVGSLTAYVLSKPRDRLIGLYLTCAVGAFLIFCLLLKWQPWHSRLHLPLFLLMAPAVAIMVTRSLGEKAALVVCGLLLLCALPWLLLNQSRPILASDVLPKKLPLAQMFDKPNLKNAYETSVFTQSEQRKCLRTVRNFRAIMRALRRSLNLKDTAI